MSFKKLTILVLQYNKPYLTERFLHSLCRHEAIDNYEVIVVDNNSTEPDHFSEFKKIFPAFYFIKNSENLGFARAINKEVKNLSKETPYLLLINNDIVLNNNSIGLCLDAIEKLKADAVTCNMLHDDGNVIDNFSSELSVSSFILLNLTGLSAVWRKYVRNKKTPSRIHYINGAFLMMRLNRFKEVGLFTEDYFMYSEDKDLMFKLSRAGASMYFVPGTHVIHSDGQSAAAVWSSQNKANMIVRQDVEVYSKYNTKAGLTILIWAWYLQQSIKYILFKDAVALLYKRALAQHLFKKNTIATA
jgi:GT2 family glycosyltransferase